MFIYCPKCKNKLKTEKNQHWCSECGFKYYRNPSPAVGVILVNSKNQIYLIKRAKDPRAGFWDSPGGFINFYETAEEAARREVKEEIGIQIGELYYLGSYTNDYLYHDIEYAPLDLFFFAKAEFDDAKKFDLEEILEGKFFDLEDLPMDKIAFKSNKKALKEYLIIHR
ncbi:MAG: NUDIX domain-containing protein [Patescibacteria group bacterium]|jgi:mutator protein MutT